jgi:hypothetical protein
MFRLATCLALLTVSAGLVTGCGSKSNRAESYSGLITKADAICTAVNTKTTAAQKTTDYDAALKASDDGIAKLKKLKPPDKLKDAYATFLAKLDANEAVVTKLVKALDAKDQAAITTLGKQSDAGNAEVDVAASAAGLKVCSSDK